MRVVKKGNDKKLKKMDESYLKLKLKKCPVCNALLLLDEEDLSGRRPLYVPYQTVDVYIQDVRQQKKIGDELGIICPYCGYETSVKLYEKKGYKLFDNKFGNYLLSNRVTIMELSMILGGLVLIILFSLFLFYFPDDQATSSQDSSQSSAQEVVIDGDT